MSNDDLIRRGDLLKPDEKSDKILILSGRVGAGKTLAMAEALMKRKIETVPAVDAVPVVRCKDCKHYNTNSCADGFGWCERLDLGKYDVGFCDLGERKDND